MIIPEGVTSIRHLAFRGCNSLRSVIIPDGVTSIGIKAFEECSNLTSTNIPKSVTYIGVDAFARCEGLKDEDGFIIVDENLCGYCGKGGDRKSVV